RARARTGGRAPPRARLAAAPQAPRRPETAASRDGRPGRHSGRVKRPRIPEPVLLAALVAAALALRTAALGRADLWADEVQTLHAVSLGWGDLVADRLRAGHAPPWFAA